MWLLSSLATCRWSAGPPPFKKVRGVRMRVPQTPPVWHACSLNFKTGVHIEKDPKTPALGYNSGFTNSAKKLKRGGPHPTGFRAHRFLYPVSFSNDSQGYSPLLRIMEQFVSLSPALFLWVDFKVETSMISQSWCQHSGLIHTEATATRRGTFSTLASFISLWGKRVSQALTSTQNKCEFGFSYFRCGDEVHPMPMENSSRSYVV